MTRLLILVFCLGSLAACDRRAPAPPSPNPQSGEQIIGNERLGWEQYADTSADLAGLGYLVYVDSAAAVELQDVSCSSIPTAAGFACTARLPRLSPGPHSLAISAFLNAVESARTPPLTVVVVGQAATSAAVPPAAEMIVETADRLRLRVSVVVDALDDPTDLAFAPDGRIFVAERGGRIRIVRDGQLLPVPAATLSDLIATDRHGLLSIAIDPAFDRGIFVYLVYTAEDGFRLARFRAEGDALVERVILMDAISPAARDPAATLRFGPDAKLYLGVDDGDLAEAAGDLGSFRGKVLRLNADATTPADQAGGTPVYALEINRPHGADWGADGALWIVENSLLQAVVAEARPQRRGRTVARYALPEGTNASALGFYRANLMPALHGDLFIAGRGRRDILRLKFDPREPARVVSAERLLADVFDSVSALGIDRDGVLYFCSSIALMKVTPERVVP